jgi:hypothetical protein
MRPADTFSVWAEVSGDGAKAHFHTQHLGGQNSGGL